MHPISTSMSFNYGGRYSVDYDLFIATKDSAPFSFQTGISYEILMEKAKNRDVVNFYGVNKLPYEFDLEIYKEDIWTIEDRKNIMNIFFQGTFKDLYFGDDDGTGDHYTSIFYNCMPVGKTLAIDIGGTVGIKIPMICSTPYPTTNPITQYFDLSDNTTTETINVTNWGNLQGEPYYIIEVEFTLATDETDISLVNNSDGGREFAFTGLDLLDTVLVNNYTKEITATTTSFITKFNKTWFRLPTGVNSIVVTGKCYLSITARFPIII